MHCCFYCQVPDGFIARFYAVCEQISPVLAWGFLGPESSLQDLCRFFKVRHVKVQLWGRRSRTCRNQCSVLCLQEQVLHFLKDVFDLDKVRYSTVESMAEDTLHLLHRRAELLLAYLGAEHLPALGGCGGERPLLPTALLEASVQ